MDKEQQQIHQAVEQLLKSQSTVVLTTVDDRGQPHATPVFYLTGENLELYWFSSVSSLHTRNIRLNPNIAVAVFAPTEQWSEIRGVQMHGTATCIADRTLRRSVTKCFRERFRLGNIFRLALARSSLYVFRPSWLRYIDNARQFGFKFEMTLPPDR